MRKGDKYSRLIRLAYAARSPWARAPIGGNRLIERERDRWDTVRRSFVPALGCIAAVIVASCSSPAEPEPISAQELVELHVSDGVNDDIALCAISILVDDVDPEMLRPDADPSPIDELAISETFAACGSANELLAEGNDEPQELAFSNEPQIYGDDRALDKLWDGCEAGDGQACDDLWEQAPVGSVYEQFGVTCGDRFEILNCADELIVDPNAVEASTDEVEASTDEAAGDERADTPDGTADETDE